MKKYTKFKKKIIESAKGAALASIFFVGASTTFAQNTDYTVPTEVHTKPSGMHMMRRWNSVPKISALAHQLGMSKGEIKAELKSGKTLKQILQERGIDTVDLGRAFQ